MSKAAKKKATAKKKAPAKKVAPAVRNYQHEVHSGLEEIVEQHPRTLSSVGDAREALDPPMIDIVDGPDAMGKVEELKFMEDILLVRVHPTGNQNDDPVPCVTVNGVRQFFVRGRDQEVRRKFVGAMALAKQTTFTQQLMTDAKGVQSYEHYPHSAPLIQFSVLHDPAGVKGSDWLRKLLRQA